VGEVLSPESSFYRAFSAATDLVIINLLTLAASIPIVTAGAALTASTRVMMEMAREEDSYIARTWWNEFRSTFRQSLGWWLPTLAFMALTWVENWLLGGMSNGTQAGTLTGLLIIAFVIILGILMWLLPLSAFFSNTVINHVGNAALLAVGHIVRTLVGLVILAFPIALFALVPASRTPVIWFMILIGVAFAQYLIALVQKSVIDNLRRQAEQSAS
jgi:uncharacterized membrane protein YesL